jgi:plastocyanin
MWNLIFVLLGVSFVLVQLEFGQVSYAQLILSVATNVEAGGGNKDAPLNHFKPQNLEIQVNETVKWHNPTTGIAYPHTVTFIGGGNVTPLPEKPSNISQNSSFDTTSLIEMMQKNLMNKTPSDLNGTDNHDISLNTSALINPSVVNSSTNGAAFLSVTSNSRQNSAKYAINGTVKYLNSGLIFPEDKIPFTLPAISTFSVKFLTTGVYHYQCLIHPEMLGTINVVPKSNSHHTM